MKDYFFHIYWGVAIFVAPLFLKTGSLAITPRLSRDIFLCVLIAISVISFGFNRKLNFAQTLPFILFILYAFFNAADFTSYLYLQNLAMILCFSVFCIQLYANCEIEYLPIILNSIALAAILQACFAILNYFDVSASSLLYTGVGSKFNYISSGSTGTLGNQNILGAYLAIALPTLFRKNWLFFIPLLVAGIILSKSDGPVVTAIVAIMAFLLFKYAKKFTGGAVTITFVVCIISSFVLPSVLTGVDTSQRFEIWNRIIGVFDINTFIFGEGLGFFPINAAYWGNFSAMLQKVVQAHNEYLETFLELGAIGMGLIFIIIKKHVNFREPILFSVFMGAMVNSFFNFPLHISPIAIIILISLFFYQKRSFYVS